MRIELNSQADVSDLISGIFGVMVVAFGIVNLFWGNDPGFGIFLLLLSFVYFPPVTAFLQKMTRIRVPGMAKIVLGIFIIWAVLGVGELFDKIGLMLRDF